MKTFQSVMKKRLQDKWLGQASLGALAVEVAKTFANSPAILHGYIRAQKLFLKGGPKEDPTSRFLNKKTILKAINDRYKKHGYEYQLTDVRLVK